MRTSPFIPLIILNIAVLATSALAQPTTQPHRTAKTLIVLVGDSTTAPQNGWGPGFIEHLTGDIQCIDKALNGRSTKSFINEGHWKETLDLKPDYILIQFGHNDQKITDPLRGTDPNTTFKENMTRFVTEARVIGAKPIFITSVSRRRWGDDGKTHSDLFDYVNPVKELGPKLNVPVIDLHALSIAFYDKIGKAEMNKLSKDYVDPTAQPAGATLPPIDNTHFNHAGSQAIGSIVAKELPKVAPELASNIK
jgi:lysophospholipase L1-like esterase